MFLAKEAKPLVINSTNLHSFVKCVRPDIFAHRGKYTFIFLTQQDDDAEENGNQCPCAEASREEQGLCITGLHVSSTVTGTYTYGQRASAALDWVVIVKYYDWQEIGTCLTTAISISSSHNSCCVI